MWNVLRPLPFVQINPHSGEVIQIPPEAEATGGPLKGLSADWVFASPRAKGEKPYYPGALIKWHLRPAAKKAKVNGRIGWHTFRRTVATLLVEHGNDIKVVQELLRHANSKVTLDLYAQAVTQAKREAQSKIVNLLRPTPLELATSMTGSEGLRS